jgi:uncharacterized repeat protein (TIGR04052 family)
MQTVALRFEPRVGSEPFACGRTYAGIGSTGTDYTALDFRFYAHDVRLLTREGDEVAVELSPISGFADDEVVLLDFETGGDCDGGNAPTNFVIEGSVPPGDYVGVRFALGVPIARNHLDNATAPAPLNLSSMYWGWMDGYKFIRVEGRTTGLPGGTVIHVGSTGCTGSAPEGTRVCGNTNVGAIEVTSDSFDPASDVIVADLGALYASLDMDVDEGGNPGCMSSPDDPECAELLPALGIGGEQRLFSIEHE